MNLSRNLSRKPVTRPNYLQLLIFLPRDRLSCHAPVTRLAPNLSRNLSRDEKAGRLGALIYLQTLLFLPRDRLAANLSRNLSRTLPRRVTDFPPFFLLRKKGSVTRHCHTADEPVTRFHGQEKGNPMLIFSHKLEAGNG
jgi:hypothetical protein